MPGAHHRARAHEVRVRFATEADLPQVRRIMTAAYGPYEALLGRASFRRYLADLLDLDQHRRQGRILVAQAHGTVCGTVAYYPDATQQGVGWPVGWASGRGLAVDTPARGVGVAEALTLDAQRRAVEDGATAFAFHTADFMHGARALYERLGFQRLPEFDSDLQEYLDGALDRPVRALAYLRWLPAAENADESDRATGVSANSSAFSAPLGATTVVRRPLVLAADLASR